MKLIIGGAYQGKLEYAKNEYDVRDGWVDGSTCCLEVLETCRGIYGFHELVRRMILGEIQGAQKQTGSPKQTTEQQTMFSMMDLSKLEQQAEAFAEVLYQKNPDILIVSNELGYGIVPMEKKDRMWREAVGRICTCLAARSDEVVRVVCGIGMRLK